MRKLFRWMTDDDDDGKKRIEEAKAQTREIEQKLTRDIEREKSRAEWFREKREHNHLAELFRDAVERGQE